MCGLNGIFAYGDHADPVSRKELLRTRERMQARGPDGAGLWVSEDERIGLAHRRLAIIDLSADGAQPMASADGRHGIVFNGEIYNHRALRAELKRQGCVFRSHSDTEVLLHLYERHGTEMCRQLRGMYALAMWDAARQQLFLARDPFGIKPLYLHDDGHTLRFASQVKALVAGGGVPAEVEPEGLEGYWTWGWVPEPLTIHARVHALVPGTWMVQHRGGHVFSKRFESVEAMLPYETLPGQELPPLREVLLDTVRHHLVADVPVGVFLSAGIDSTVLAALTAECGGTLRTVTLGFEEYRGTAADETVLAEEVARRYGAQHETVWIGRQDFAHVFEPFMHDMDQPSTDGLNTWLVSRPARQVGLKVVLSGLGGDEFFGGYPLFQQLPRMRRLARPFAHVQGLGRWVRRLSAPLLRRFTSEKYAGLLEHGHDWHRAYLLRRGMCMPWEQPVHAQSPDGRPAKRPPVPAPAPAHMPSPVPTFAHAHSTVSYLEATRYMRNQLLRDSDWASMAHGLELRVPLVDAVLTRHLAARTARGLTATKQQLAAAAQPALPPAITQRAKTGVTVPVRHWLQTGARQAADLATPAERGLRGWQRAVLQGQGLPVPT